MNKKIGFIGCGNMGSAMVEGIINSGLLNKEDIIASCSKEESAKKISKKLKYYEKEFDPFSRCKFVFLIL